MISSAYGFHQPGGFIPVSQPTRHIPQWGSPGSDQVRFSAVHAKPGQPLTDQEIQTLQKLADGSTYANIAEEGRLTPGGISGRLVSVYRKLGLSPTNKKIDRFITTLLWGLQQGVISLTIHPESNEVMQAKHKIGLLDGRQQNILTKAAKGAANKSIALDLMLAEATVRGEISTKIVHKLGVVHADNSRWLAVRMALLGGLVKLEDLPQVPSPSLEVNKSDTEG